MSYASPRSVFGGRVPAYAVVGLAIVIVMVACAVFAPWIAPFGEAELLGPTWEGPSGTHLLGLDSLGRDMFSRLVYGARVTLGLTLVITVLAFMVGGAAGFLASTIGGVTEAVMGRIVDILMSIPMLIFALVLISAMGNSLPGLIVVAALLEGTRVFRVCQAVATDVLSRDYVEVARLRKESATWIAFREVMPNMAAPLMAEFGLRFCYTLLFVSSLNFLGFGVQPPTADWGGMVRDNAPAIGFGGLAPLYPAAAIALLAIGLNLVVDWIMTVYVRRTGRAD